MDFEAHQPEGRKFWDEDGPEHVDFAASPLQKRSNKEGFDPDHNKHHYRSGGEWVQDYDAPGQPTLRYMGATTGWYKPPRWSSQESFDSHEIADDEPSVYLIHAPVTRRVKIGRSRQVYKRFSSIRTMSGTDVELVAVLPGEDELHLHKRFADRRITGEWFDESVLDDLRADNII